MYVKEGSNWSLARLLDSSKTKKGRQGEMKLPAPDPRRGAGCNSRGGLRQANDEAPSPTREGGMRGS